MNIAAKDRTANDWVALGLLSLGTSSGLAGAYWLFRFDSAQARVRCVCRFAGIGFGLGLGLWPLDFAEPQKGNRIRGWRGFSASNLDGAGGILMNSGADMFGFSKGKLGISAYDRNFIPYFSFQDVPGPNAGVGIDASWIQGEWILLDLVEISASDALQSA